MLIPFYFPPGQSHRPFASGLGGGGREREKEVKWKDSRKMLFQDEGCSV